MLFIFHLVRVDINVKHVKKKRFQDIQTQTTFQIRLDTVMFAQRYV
jgi:hypothetical protein